MRQRARNVRCAPVHGVRPTQTDKPAIPDRPATDPSALCRSVGLPRSVPCVSLAFCLSPSVACVSRCVCALEWVSARARARVCLFVRAYLRARVLQATALAAGRLGFQAQVSSSVSPVALVSGHVAWLLRAAPRGARPATLGVRAGSSCCCTRARSAPPARRCLCSAARRTTTSPSSVGRK